MLRYLIRLTFYCILRLWTICLVKKHLLRTWYRTWLSGISGATAKLVENIKLPMKIWFTFSLLWCLSGFCWILMVSVRVALQHVSFDLSDFRAALLSVSSHSATARLKWPYDKLSCWMTEPNSFTWSYLSDFTFLPGTSPSPPQSDFFQLSLSPWSYCESLFPESAGIRVTESKVPVTPLSLLESYYTGADELSPFQGSQVAHSPCGCGIRFLGGRLAQAEAPEMNSFRCNPHLLPHC